nr:hypothetical protein [Tanacetum cinerariifolium]
KKTKKNQLKQQYGNFKVEGSETLEQTFNRLYAIIKYKDITQIDEDDIEEMNIKWNMAIEYEGRQVLEEDWECRAPRSQDIGRRESYKQGPNEEEHAPKALMAIDRIGWDWSYMANEEENHALVPDDEAPT